MSGPPDPDTVRQLLVKSVPDLAGEPIRPVEGAGTDNHIYRIGEQHTLRIARDVNGVASLSGREPDAMRNLAGLPLETPKLVAQGMLAEPDGWPWLVCTWLEGDSLEASGHSPGPVDAGQLALFLLDLQGQDRRHAAPPGPANHWRGTALGNRESLTREALTRVADEFDAIALLAIWQAALHARPCRDEDRTWIHGDLHPGNLLVQAGSISGVIDWGLSGLGDPACDLMAGFTVFEGRAREAFWQATGITEAVWQRARGWALSTALIAYAFYRGSDTPIAARTRKLLDEFSGQAG